MSAHGGARQRIQEKEAVAAARRPEGQQPEGRAGQMEEEEDEDKGSMQQYAQGLYFVQK
jgi:hypothetical protein